MFRHLRATGHDLLRPSRFDHEEDFSSENALPPMDLRANDAEMLHVVDFAVSDFMEFETNTRAKREKYSEIAVRDSTR
jgi:hypothetical protein